MLWGCVKPLPTGKQTVNRRVSRTSLGQYTELPLLACSVVSLGLYVTSDVIQFRKFSTYAEGNGVHVTWSKLVHMFAISAFDFSSH